MGSGVLRADPYSTRLRCEGWAAFALSMFLRIEERLTRGIAVLDIIGVLLF